MFLSSLTDSQKETFFCLAHDVVVSDGELNVGEHVMMEEMRREMSLDDGLEPHYVDVHGMEKIFDTKRARIIVLIALIRLGYADGAFEIEEQSFLKVLCELFEIDDTEFVLIENWVRRLIALEREASDFL
jgi:tellurite resistance protein